MIAKPIREFTEDEICELLFASDWRLVRNSFNNTGAYRQLISTLKNECSVGIADEVCVIDAGGLKIAVSQIEFEKMYMMV